MLSSFNLQKYAPSFGIMETTWQALAGPYFMDSQPVPDGRFWILQNATVYVLDSTVGMQITIMPNTSRRVDRPIPFDLLNINFEDFGAVMTWSPRRVDVGNPETISTQGGPYVLRSGQWVRVFHPDVTILNSRGVLKLAVAELEVCQ